MSFDAAEVGASLREARIALRGDLLDAAHDLRIRHVYLQAIEDGRLEDLPGLAYQTGFLRAYGNYLGLDGTGLADRLKAARDATPGHDRIQVFAPIDERHLPTRSVLLLAALLAVAVYGGWYFIANIEGDPVERVAALPDRLASLLDEDSDTGSDPVSAGSATDGSPQDAAGSAASATPGPEARDGENAAGNRTEKMAAAAPEPLTAAPEPRTRTTPQEPVGQTSPADPVRETPVRGPSDAPAPPAGSNPPATGSTPAGTAAGPRAAIETTTLPAPSPPSPGERSAVPERPAAEPGEADSAPRIVLRAVTDSWIEIRSGDASLVYSGLLREGDSYVVPDRQGLKMVTGNAGGLDILVDGKEIPRLGPPGAVKRDIDLDPDSLRGQGNP